MENEIATNIVTWSDIAIPLLIAVGVISIAIIGFLFKDNKKLRDGNLKNVETLLTKLEGKMNTLVTQKELECEIKIAKIEIENKYNLFVAKAEGEVKTAKNALNTANIEVRTMKTKLRGQVDAIIHAVKELPEGEKTAKGLSKRIQIETNEFMKNHEDLV